MMQTTRKKYLRTEKGKQKTSYKGTCRLPDLTELASASLSTSVFIYKDQGVVFALKFLKNPRKQAKFPEDKKKAGQIRLTHNWG